ncbi:Transcriptional activator DEMETER [Camellia lanceoleosa]|uniref:Transcriptional activator DEMETER n=1 Tax=Camellia lanceoleosa TaxID=1840588 RepID=A0ACC0F7D7_9ERIC|nr:Transcriptional activator DEMETER [Camellia lanceoleosa]
MGLGYMIYYFCYLWVDVSILARFKFLKTTGRTKSSGKNPKAPSTALMSPKKGSIAAMVLAAPHRMESMIIFRNEGPLSVGGNWKNHVSGSFSTDFCDSAEFNAMSSADSMDAAQALKERIANEFDLNKSPCELGFGDSSNGDCEDILAGKQGIEIMIRHALIWGMNTPYATSSFTEFGNCVEPKDNTEIYGFHGLNQDKHEDDDLFAINKDGHEKSRPSVRSTSTDDVNLNQQSRTKKKRYWPKVAPPKHATCKKGSVEKRKYVRKNNLKGSTKPSRRHRCIQALNSTFSLENHESEYVQNNRIKASARRALKFNGKDAESLFININDGKRKKDIYKDNESMVENSADMAFGFTQSKKWNKTTCMEERGQRMRRLKTTNFASFGNTTMYDTLQSIIAAEDGQRILKKRRLRRRRQLSLELGGLLELQKMNKQGSDSFKCVLSLAPFATTTKKRSHESTRRLNLGYTTLIPSCNQFPSAPCTQTFHGRVWNQEVLFADNKNMVTKRQFKMGLFTRGLRISNEHSQLIVFNQNAYGTDGEHGQNNEVWKLLMENGGEDVEEKAKDKEKWWEEQREVFVVDELDSFIARMHLIQGDRRFLPWKGSVVDSVVGVFLTQNVSDHLSSSRGPAHLAEINGTTPGREISDEAEDRTVVKDEFSPHDFVDSVIDGNPTRTSQLSTQTLDANSNGSLVSETKLDLDRTVVKDEFSPHDFVDFVTDGNPTSTSQLSTIEVFSGITEIVQLEETACLLNFSSCENGNLLFNESLVDCDISENWRMKSKEQAQTYCLITNDTHAHVLQTPRQKDVGDIRKIIGCVESSGSETIIWQKATPRAQEATVGQCASLSKCQVLPECNSQTEVNRAKGRLFSNNHHGEKKKSKFEEKQDNPINWDDLRKTYIGSRTKETTLNTMDSLDWEEVRQATVDEVAGAIKGRGQHRVLAGRIKEFLDRVVRDHGSLNLEWLRDVPPDKAKTGVEKRGVCKALSLHHHAFPVDVNVGRVAVRLGWVPLQPYELHYQMITFGKEAKSKLQCMSNERRVQTLCKCICKNPDPDITIYLGTIDSDRVKNLLHVGSFDYPVLSFGIFGTPKANLCSLFISCRTNLKFRAILGGLLERARLACQNLQEKSMLCSMVPSAALKISTKVITPAIVSLPGATFSVSRYQTKNWEPIFEHPPSQCLILQKSGRGTLKIFFGEGHSRFYYESEDDIPTVRLDTEEFKKKNHGVYLQKQYSLEEGEMSNALVALTSEAASIYELPDSHIILKELEKREPDDPSPYLLAIWNSGETSNSSKSPRKQCDSLGSEPCNEYTCSSCNNSQDFQTVSGTILIPCRTATRGSFPLNGTYFQVNEVFADYESSERPLVIPRSWIWNLRRRTLYCGAYGSAIFRGFVCVRAFNRKTRAPAHLAHRFHISTVIPRGKRKFTEDQ